MSNGGGRRGNAQGIAPLAEGADEPYQIRPATVADLPWLAELIGLASAARCLMPSVTTPSGG